MDDIVRASLTPQAIGGTLISAFAVAALLLAAMGLFGVVSGSVTRRHHELAVRLALGADPSRVLRLVLKEGALLVMVGLLIGAPGIYMASRLIRGLLVGVSPSDPLTLLAAALGLLLVTAACYGDRAGAVASPGVNVDASSSLHKSTSRPVGRLYDPETRRQGSKTVY